MVENIVGKLRLLGEGELANQIELLPVEVKKLQDRLSIAESEIVSRDETINFLRQYFDGMLNKYAAMSLACSNAESKRDQLRAQLAEKVESKVSEPVGYYNRKYDTFFRLSELACAERNSEMLATGEIVRVYSELASPSKADVPEGWKLVPVEPSGDMKSVGINKKVFTGHDGMDHPIYTYLSDREFYELWKALLACSPIPPLKDEQL